MTELDVIGALNGTDKSSSADWGWDYLRHYEELFARWRTEEINLIEIGVLDGASLATWPGYFTKATLVGIDIDPDCRRFATDRVVIRIGSQDNAAFLQGVAAAYPPTIVIDDGSHLAHHMIASFETLFPQLLPGGIYVFEDLSFHFEDGVGQWLGAKAHQGLAETPIFDYLSRLVRARAANQGAPAGCPESFDAIDQITVFGGGLAVRKKAPRNLAPAIAAFETALRQSPSNSRVAACRYAEFLCRHNHDLHRAASLLQAGSAGQTELRILFRVMLQLGRLDEAAHAAHALVALDNGNTQNWDLVSDVEHRRGNLDGELAALRRLVALRPDYAWYQHCLSCALERHGDSAAALAAARAAYALEPNNAEYAARQGVLF